MFSEEIPAASVTFMLLCSRMSFNSSFTLTAYVKITATESAEAMKGVSTAFVHSGLNDV